MTAHAQARGEPSHDADCLKLTSYFGERQRAGGRFVADTALELFGRREIATSVLLRGALGFGLKHHLRTDQLLTLSEDLPLTCIAVDARPKIEATLAELAGLPYRGLVTLERARLRTGEATASALPRQLREATKLTIYVGRRERVYRTAAFAAVCELLHRRGVATATVFLGVDGTNHGRRTRARFFAGNGEVPMMIVAVGDGAVIGRVLAELGGLLRRPTLTLERVRLCKRDGELLARPHQLPSHDNGGTPLWQKLTVYTSERALYRGQPVHQALVRQLRGDNARGATVLRGIWGFQGPTAPHGDRFWQFGRGAPVCTVVLERPDRVTDVFDTVHRLTGEHGVVTSELVPALRVATEEHPGELPRLADYRY